MEAGYWVLAPLKGENMLPVQSESECRHDRYAALYIYGGPGFSLMTYSLLTTQRY